jgi:hypothetical protein
MSTHTSITNLVKTNFIEILEDKNNCFGFRDWFCNDSSLKNKAKTLVSRLRAILKNNKRFNPDTTYVVFNNNLECRSGNLHDNIQIYDIESDDCLYSITPRDPSNDNNASVWSFENDFESATIIGAWNEIKRFFANQH